MCLAQGHNAVTLVRLEPPAPRFRVKHSQSFSWTEIYFGHFVQAVQILFGHLEFFRTIFQTLITKHYDWFALVSKHFRGKIMQTSQTLTEVWPISDRIIRQKYYCITVHYRTVCTSENRLGQTVQTGQQALGHLELFSD